MSIAAKVAGAALALLLAGQTWRLHQAQLDAAKAQTAIAAHTAAAERAARDQADAYRKLEGQHRDRITQIDTETSAALAAARADATRAAGTADRLRGYLAAYTARQRAAAQAAAAAGQCAPDNAAAIDLLADMFRRADSRAGDLAEIADDARARGAGCERSYGAVMD